MDSKCQSASARFTSANTDAIVQATTSAIVDGTYLCLQPVMDALADYQAACGKDHVKTLSSNFSDTQSLQSFCLQTTGVALAIAGESGTLLAQTQVQSTVTTSIVSGFQFHTSSTVSPTPTLSVPDVSGLVATANNSVVLYAGIGATTMFILIVSIGCFARQRRRNQAALKQLQMPHAYPQDSNKAYSVPGIPRYNLSATTAAVPVPPPAEKLQYTAQPIQSSGSQYSSGKVSTPSSSKLNDLPTTPISAPVSDEKTSMMNAAYVSATHSNVKVPSDGSNILASNIADAGKTIDMTVPQGPVTSNPNEWSVAEVVAWARTIPHFGSKLGGIMLEYQVSGHVLMGLTRDSMKDELGLVFGEVTQLETSIAQLQVGSSVQENGLPPSYDAEVDIRDGIL
ncbi:hypothetical protein HDU81_010807 [Chytriomyces hyalinus]|nr:hypothetical protein HDU81_010807 [Chytriomyces hyalinus]